MTHLLPVFDFISLSISISQALLSEMPPPREYLDRGRESAFNPHEILSKGAEMRDILKNAGRELPASFERFSMSHFAYRFVAS